MQTNFPYPSTKVQKRIQFKQSTFFLRRENGVVNVLELDRANRGDVDVPLICRWSHSKKYKTKFEKESQHFGTKVGRDHGSWFVLWQTLLGHRWNYSWYIFSSLSNKLFKWHKKGQNWNPNVIFKEWKKTGRLTAQTFRQLTLSYGFTCFVSRLRFFEYI